MRDDTKSTLESWEALVKAARDLGLTPEETRAWLQEMRELNEMEAEAHEVSSEDRGE